MILGFDIDGVLCDIDNATLGLINEYGSDGTLEKMRTLEGYYYSNRLPQIHLGNFMSPGDEFVVITARPNYLRDITVNWLNLHYPSYKQLIMVGGDGWASEYDNYREWSKKCQIAKIEAIKLLGVKVYFEDNPRYVKAYREAGITTIQYGGRV